MAKMPKQKPYQSKQDVATPRKFLDAVEKKYGRIVFDLAAHAGNKVCENYYAPKELKYIYDPKKSSGFVSDIVSELVKAGAVEAEVKTLLYSKYGIDPDYGLIDSKEKIKIIVPNRDQNSNGFDSLSKDWSKLSGNLWLNPEYEDIGPWAEKCQNTGSLNINFSGDRGQKIFLLIPSSTGTEYWANYIHEKALVNLIRPRISFDGIAPYPKDLSLIIYGLNPGYECWKWS